MQHLQLVEAVLVEVEQHFADHPHRPDDHLEQTADEQQEEPTKAQRAGTLQFLARHRACKTLLDVIFGVEDTF